MPVHRLQYLSANALDYVLDTIPQLIWVCAGDGKVQYLNRRWSDYTGKPLESQLGEGWLECVHPRDRAAVSRAWREAIDGGTPYDTAYRLRSAAGEYRWFDVRAVPKRSGKGDIEAWIGSSTDAERHYELEASLRAREATLHRQDRLLDLVPASGFDFDTGRINLWSAGAVRAFGFEESLAIGQPIRELLDVRFPTRLGEALRQVERLGEWSGELDIRVRDGSRRIILTQWLYDPGDEWQGPSVLQMHTDISPLREAERSARTAQEHLLVALSSGLAGTWSWEAATNRVELDHALLTLLSGIETEDGLAPAARTQAAIREQLGRAKPAHPGIAGDFSVGRTAAARWLTLQGNLQFDSRGTPQRASGVCADVSARHAAERELEMSRARLREYAQWLDSAMEEERAHIAHELHDELGQRLTSLKMDARWIDAHGHARRGQAERWGQRLLGMVALIDDTIDKVRSLSLELRPAEIEQVGLRLAIEEFAARYAQRTGIRCELDLCSEPLVHPAQKLTLFRVLQEAMTNAARHSGATTVTVRLLRAAATVVLEVSDNGRGLGEDAGKRERLGIVGMHERALRLGGTLEISGSPGEGTRVRLELPR